jgi:hypothetical protein
VTADELRAVVWEFVAYFQPEFRMALIFCVLALTALWVIALLKVADRVR